MQPSAVHTVTSDRDRTVTYSVSEWPDGQWACSCPDFEIRRAPKGEHCKHIARIVAARRVGTLRAQIEDLFPDDTIDARIRAASAANAPV